MPLSRHVVCQYPAKCVCHNCWRPVPWWAWVLVGAGLATWWGR